MDFQIDRDTFVALGEEGVADRAYDAAFEFYGRKRDALARPFLQTMKQVAESDAENKPEKVYVDFADGRRALRAVVPIEDAIATEGQEVNDALERVTVLSMIDAAWTEHLRKLDELKEGIGLRAYGQRDPVIEYKMDAFKIFKEMVEQVDQDVVSFVMRSGPLVGKQEGGRAPRRQQTRRLDPRRAQSTHEAAKPSFGVAGGQGGGGARKDPTAKTAPVVVDEKVGRNDPCPCGSGKKFKHCHGR